MGIVSLAKGFANNLASGKIVSPSGAQKFGSFGEAISFLKVVKGFWRAVRRDKDGLAKFLPGFWSLTVMASLQRYGMRQLGSSLLQRKFWQRLGKSLCNAPSEGLPMANGRSWRPNTLFCKAKGLKG